MKYFFENAKIFASTFDWLPTVVTLGLATLSAKYARDAVIVTKALSEKVTRQNIFDRLGNGIDALGFESGELVTRPDRGYFNDAECHSDPVIYRTFKNINSLTRTIELFRCSFSDVDLRKNADLAIETLVNFGTRVRNGNFSESKIEFNKLSALINSLRSSIIGN